MNKTSGKIFHKKITIVSRVSLVNRQSFEQFQVKASKFYFYQFSYQKKIEKYKQDEHH